MTRIEDDTGVASDSSSAADPHHIPSLAELLASASRLQEIVPDAVLVGGRAAALFAHHRLSVDHDRVLVDLHDRFDAVLEAVETESQWVTNRVTPGKVILGELGGIESGIRQLIRARPLETGRHVLPDDRARTVPTIAETLCGRYSRRPVTHQGWWPGACVPTCDGRA